MIRSFAYRNSTITAKNAPTTTGIIMLMVEREGATPVTSATATSNARMTPVVHPKKEHVSLLKRCGCCGCRVGGECFFVIALSFVLIRYVTLSKNIIGDKIIYEKHKTYNLQRQQAMRG